MTKRQRAKLIGLAVLLIVVVVLIVQNLEEMKVQILFAEVVMPKALMLLLVLLVGVAAGYLAAGLRRQ